MITTTIRRRVIVRWTRRAAHPVRGRLPVPQHRVVARRKTAGGCGRPTPMGAGPQPRAPPHNPSTTETTRWPGSEVTGFGRKGPADRSANRCIPAPKPASYPTSNTGSGATTPTKTSHPDRQMRAHAHVEDHILACCGPVHRLRRQRGVASCRVLGSGPGLVPPLCHRAPGPGAAQTAALATVAHTRPHRSYPRPSSALDGWPTAPVLGPTDTSPPTERRSPVQSRTPVSSRTSPPARPSTHPDGQPTPREPKPSIDTNQPDVP